MSARILSPRADRVVTAATVGAIAAGIGIGVVIGRASVEPVTITREVTVAVPAPCREALDAAEDVTRLGETARQNAAGTLAAGNDLAETVLTADPDAIEQAARDLDAAKRIEQQASLDLAAAQVRLGDAADQCRGRNR